MTHEVAPAVLVIHEVAAVREAIQGGNAAMEVSAFAQDDNSWGILGRRGGYFFYESRIMG
jgi:hypothetical protein